jgi:hypothetical protein
MEASSKNKYTLFRKRINNTPINTNNDNYKLLITYWGKKGFVKNNKILLYGFKNLLEILLLLIKKNIDIQRNFENDEISCIEHLLNPRTVINSNNNNENGYVRLFILSLFISNKSDFFKKISKYIDLFSINNHINKKIKSLYNVFDVEIIKSIISLYGQDEYFWDFLKLSFTEGSDYNPIGKIRLIYKCNKKIYTIVKNSNNKKPLNCQKIGEKQDLGRVYNGLYAQWNELPNNMNISENSVNQENRNINNLLQNIAPKPRKGSKLVSNKSKFEYIIENWNIVEQILDKPEIIDKKLDYNELQLLGNKSKIGTIELMFQFREVSNNIGSNQLKDLIENIINSNDYLERSFLLYKFLLENKISLFRTNNFKYLTKSGRYGTFLSLLYSLYIAIKKVKNKNELLNILTQKKSHKSKVRKQKSHKSKIKKTKMDKSNNKITTQKLAQNLAFNNSIVSL